MGFALAPRQPGVAQPPGDEGCPDAQVAGGRAGDGTDAGGERPSKRARPNGPGAGLWGLQQAPAAPGEAAGRGDEQQEPQPAGQGRLGATAAAAAFEAACAAACGAQPPAAASVPVSHAALPGLKLPPALMAHPGTPGQHHASGPTPPSTPPPPRWSPAGPAAGPQPSPSHAPDPAAQDEVDEVSEEGVGGVGGGGWGGGAPGGSAGGEGDHREGDHRWCEGSITRGVATIVGRVDDRCVCLIIA
jgi:hypothetical protein